MKVNNNFVLRKVGESAVVVPVGSACKSFNGAIKLNATAQLIWECIYSGKTERQTVEKLMEQYEVSEDRAIAAYNKMLRQMADIGAVILDS